MTPSSRKRAEPDANDVVTSLVDDCVSDVEEGLAADAVTERDEFASPEEAVLSVRDNVPGTTDPPRRPARGRARSVRRE
jgi:hypothetical protein